jgi:small subunit ribosomal protein S6
VRDYEFTIIIQPQLEEGERDKLIERISQLLVPGAEEDAKPTINVWGMRRLAYPIEKNIEGYYVLYEAKVDPARITAIESSIQYMEDVLRYLSVRKEG